MLLLARNVLAGLTVLLLAAPSTASTQEPEIHFNSSCDFSELTMNLIGGQDLNPDVITLDIKLQPEASTQLAQISRRYLNSSLSIYMNEVKVSTVTIRAELNSPHLRVALDKQTAQKVLPGLLNTQCLAKK